MIPHLPSTTSRFGLHFAALALLAGAARASAENLLPNPGFEAAADADP
jgi:hypothetical protein